MESVNHIYAVPGLSLTARSGNRAVRQCVGYRRQQRLCNLAMAGGIPVAVLRQKSVLSKLSPGSTSVTGSPVTARFSSLRAASLRFSSV